MYFKSAQVNSGFWGNVASTLCLHKIFLLPKVPMIMILTSSIAHSKRFSSGLRFPFFFIIFLTSSAVLGTGHTTWVNSFLKRSIGRNGFSGLWHNLHSSGSLIFDTILRNTCSVNKTFQLVKMLFCKMGQNLHYYGSLISLSVNLFFVRVFKL